MQRPRRTPLTRSSGTDATAEKVDYLITRLCGHTETIQIFAGANPQRSKWVQAQQDRDCRDCYRQKMALADQDAVDAGRRVALEGGPKQVPWAQTIRQSRSSQLRDWLTREQGAGLVQLLANRLTRETYDQAITDALNAFADLMQGVEFSMDDYDHSGWAKWWIDGRDTPIEQIVARLLPDRDILGAGVFTRLSADGWTPLVMDTVPEAEEAQTDDSDGWGDVPF